MAQGIGLIAMTAQSDKMGQDWAKLGQNWAKLLGQNLPKDPNAIGVPIVIVETCPFGSRHRFDCYDRSEYI